MNRAVQGDAQLEENLRRAAGKAGIDRIGIGPALPPPTAGKFLQWLEKGYAAGMRYMERDPGKRADPRKVFEGARSIIAAAVAYRPLNDSSSSQPTIARYARGPDYHDIVGSRLKALIRAIQEAGGQARAYVDTGPLLERGLAAEAGLGWIGKNTCLIAPSLGSWCFLGIVLTDLALAPDPYLEPRCEDCVLCLEACPTGALFAPYELDSRLCLSYHTIENRGSVPVKIRKAVNGRLFGCDRCQEVCPFNCDSGGATRKAFSAPLATPPIEEILEMAQDEFTLRFRGTCLSRPGRVGLVRNAILVSGNLKLTEHLEALRRLSKDPHPVIREHATWALEQITRSG